MGSLADRGVTATGLHPALPRGLEAAKAAYARATGSLCPEELAEIVGLGADGTPSQRLDRIVEDAVLDAVAPLGINVLSEEAGFHDRGSAVTLVVDPVDGTANAAAGIPPSCFAAAIAYDDRFEEALVSPLDTRERWTASAGAEHVGFETTGRSRLDGASVSLLRPRAETADAWWRIASRVGRVRVLGCSTFEGTLVCLGRIDAFVDPGGDVHRLVDLAPLVVLSRSAGAFVTDALGRPIELDIDLTRRWSGIVAATPELAREIVDEISC